MNDSKSKLPDFKELTSMTKKLFSDVKNSVCEIIDDYKEKRKEDEAIKTSAKAPDVKKPSPKPVSPDIKTSVDINKKPKKNNNTSGTSS